jgi:hypothetical protein
MPIRIATAILALTIAGSAMAGAVEDKALKDAVFDLDFEAVKAALKNGANPNSSDPSNRQTPLGTVAIANLRGMSSPSIANKHAGFMESEVVHSKALEITKVLFAAGAKLGPYDRTILHTPIACGNVGQVALFIDKGASALTKIDGYTPTEIAKKYRQDATYRLLVARGGAAVGGKSAAQLALVQAADDSNFEDLQAALAAGAEINGRDPRKETALAAALDFPILLPDRALAISWLLDHGADGNLVDKDGDGTHQLTCPRRGILAPTDFTGGTENSLVGRACPRAGCRRRSSTCSRYFDLRFPARTTIGPGGATAHFPARWRDTVVGRRLGGGHYRAMPLAKLCLGGIHERLHVHVGEHQGIVERLAPFSGIDVGHLPPQVVIGDALNRGCRRRY